MNSNAELPPITPTPKNRQDRRLPGAWRTHPRTLDATRSPLLHSSPISRTSTRPVNCAATAPFPATRSKSTRSIARYTPLGISAATGKSKIKPSTSKSSTRIRPSLPRPCETNPFPFPDTSRNSCQSLTINKDTGQPARTRFTPHIRHPQNTIG